MTIISSIILIFITVGLTYTYWCMISSVVKQLRPPWPLAVLVIVVFIALFGTLISLLAILFIKGPVNAGSLMGMLLGITLILSGIRTFTR